MLAVARDYLEPIRDAGVDTLVLGCTHYPLLSGVIQLAMGEDVALVSSAEETSKDVLRILTKTDMLADPEAGVYTAYEITIASIYNALSWWLETLMHAVDG